MASETSTTETGDGPISERLHEAFKKLSKGRPDDYYRALGKIAVNFARIEIGTMYILGMLSGMKPEIGVPLIGDMTLNRKLEKICKVVPIAVANLDNQTKIKQIADRIDKARKSRNAFIHSIWYLLGQETGVRYDHNTKKNHLVTLEELDAFNTVLEVLLLDLLDLEKLLIPALTSKATAKPLPP